MTHTTKAKRWLGISLAILGTLFLLYVVFLAGRDKEISRVVLPDKTQEVAYLPDPSTGQRLKLIRFAQDGFTRISGTIFWKSGLIEDLTFGGPANAVTSSIEYYPLNEGDGKDTRGIKRSDSRFAVDGSYTYHAVYRADGTMERIGELQPMGGYNSTFYFEDGKTVWRQRNFDEKKRYRAEKIFRRNGTLFASIYSEAGDPNKTSTMLYREDGTTSASFTRDPIDGERGKVYDLDGQTMLVEYARDYYNVQEIFLDKAGNLLQVRDGSRMGNQLVVRGYEKSKDKMIMVYRQRWMMTQTVGPDADKIKLRRVEYFDAANDRACEIQMDKEGLVPTTISCPEANGGQTVKKLSEDGLTIKSVEVYNKNRQLAGSSNGNGAKVNIPHQWLENIRPTPLPDFKDEDSPPKVYDFH
ncbi:MAG: hypothetical protein LCH63_15410 [Candidatus Melainabacteria bacterium]|nr:hypothetical protein [Candidatus Melainabacteria bacterium]